MEMLTRSGNRVGDTIERNLPPNKQERPPRRHDSLIGPGPYSSRADDPTQENSRPKSSSTSEVQLPTIGRYHRGSPEATEVPPAEASR